MQAFEISELAKRCDPMQASAAEFLRVSVMSLSVYRLQAGGADPQLPHTEDEVYYVVRGRGVFRAGQEERPVQPGTVLFVQAGVEHRFERISKDLMLLVVFAPAKGTKAKR